VSEFGYTVRKSGDVHIARGGVVVTTLRGAAAARFVDAAERCDPDGLQRLLARVTGDYRRGNEREARSHPRSGSR
jgi:hypothetical protein